MLFCYLYVNGHENGRVSGRDGDDDPCLSPQEPYCCGLINFSLSKTKLLRIRLVFSK